MMKKYVLLLLLSGIATTAIVSQNPHRFDEEIIKFANLSVLEHEDTAIFTGSSSIRFWENLAQDCDGMHTINTGFGGSHMSDLLYFLNETVLVFRPSKVYIYEGDNDIAAKKEAKEIVETAKLIVNKIHDSNPNTEIYFISAKPSPSRWNHKERYLAFNALLKSYCDYQPQVYYIDVWNPMLDEKGRANPHIFISDSLHMNRQGYILWKDIICNDSK